VPEEQVDIARKVAAKIGIELLEIETDEGKDPTYIANAGKACLACKTHLYSALEAVAEAAMTSANASSTGGNGQPRRVVLYNGTNADDTRDPTRLGLVAASNFRVESPLLQTTKADVRRAAKHLGLPNHDYAAAPCLRSRLAFGVEATRAHLQAVGEAERRVRAALELDPTANLRVRMLARNQAMVELDQHVLIDTDAENLLDREGFENVFQELGFASYGVRAFKSGAVAAVAK
jgi:PP-loop superfamily ATP-utilizing enzyme